MPVVPIPGGFQPRAAIGYSLYRRAGGGGPRGAAPSVRGEVEAAAALVGELVAEWGPDAPEDSLAKSIARSLHGTVPIIAGAELAARPRSLKSQFNENSALPAFASPLPEADHNEVVGWDAALVARPVLLVSLEDPARTRATCCGPS